jgi:hypothetical protein
MKTKTKKDDATMKVTQEMEEAGLRVLAESGITDDLRPADSALVVEIFLAMSSASRHSIRNADQEKV